jgi:hypothetical protein
MGSEGRIHVGALAQVSSSSSTALYPKATWIGLICCANPKPHTALGEQ